MKQIKLLLFFLCSLACKGQVPAPFQLIDNFNRNDSVKVGVPAGSTFEYWREYGDQSFCATAIGLKSNTMQMSNGCFSPAKAANIDMTYKYPVIFSTAPGKLEWYFNMQQNKAELSGFNPGQDGVAFVVGCNVTDPADSPKGYAVVFGDATTTDRIRLVSFTSSFTNGAFTELISVPGPVTRTAHMSIRVTYDPCTGEWSLRMRNDGAAFSDPSTITGAPMAGETIINNTFTGISLPFIGGILVHSSTITVKYDNVFAPDGNTIGSFIWNGNVSSDFQVAQNWTPARTCIKPGDRLLFNASSPSINVLTNVPAQVIRQLWITDNRAVTLMDVYDGVASTLSLTGAGGADLVIDAGASLTLDAAGSNPGNAMVIDLGTGTTANIAGDFVFKNSFGGTNAHRLLAADAGSILFASGGKCYAKQLQGNPFGNTGTTNTVIFNSGSMFQYEDGGDPFALAQPLSKVVFNRGSLYRHLSDNVPSVAGRTYSNFEFSGNSVVATGATTGTFTTDSLKIITGSLQFTGSGNNQPLNVNVLGNLTIQPGTTLSFDPVAASTLTFNSNYTQQHIRNYGTFKAGRLLTVKLNSNYIIPQLIIDNDIKIAGILQIQSGTLQLEGDIHLLSDLVRTASVAPVNGKIAYGAGLFVVERYISARKAWQFLAAPVNTTQTIKEAWQENNLPGTNMNPGFGTMITSNIIGNGFDSHTPAGPTMKTYNPQTNGWTGVANTNLLPITNKKGYMLLVRGDRSVVNYNDIPTATILRTKGKLFAAGVPENFPPYTTVLAGKFESIGNPYASAIDFSLVGKGVGIQNLFYTWDPLLTGSYGLGNYQCFTYNGSSYDVTPGGGSYAGTNRFIESGQAFLVKCTTTNSNISFTENCKVTSSTLVNRGGPVNDQLRVNLYVREAAKSVLADGVLSLFKEEYDKELDQNDALKMYGGNESIAIMNAQTALTAEFRRLLPMDTIFYRLQGLHLRDYELQVVRTNFHIPDCKIFVVDQWLGIKRQVSFEDTSRIAFTVTLDSGSYNPGRFYIVFERERATAESASITIMPNPVQPPFINILFKDQPAGKYYFQLFDEAGRQLLTALESVIDPVSRVKLKISTLSTGWYNLIITRPDGTRFSQKIIR